MIKASAHIWLVVCYGTLAAVCGLASIGSISAGIGWMPMLIGGVVFTGGGVLHLGIMLVRREKQYVRQMLILSQAVQDLQKTSDDPAAEYEAPVRAAEPQYRPEPPRPDSLRPETPRAPVRDDPGFDEDATLNFAEPDYELEEETRLRQMRAHAGGKRRPGTRKKPAALDELLDDDEPRRAPPLTRQPSRDFEDEDSGEDDFDEYDFEEEKVKTRFDQENKTSLIRMILRVRMRFWKTRNLRRITRFMPMSRVIRRTPMILSKMTWPMMILRPMTRVKSGR